MAIMHADLAHGTSMPRRENIIRFAATMPVAQRPFATPVAVTLNQQGIDIFQPAPSGEARIQLVPNTGDAEDGLVDQALKSPNPLDGLRFLISQLSTAKRAEPQPSNGNKLSFIRFRDGKELQKQQQDAEETALREETPVDHARELAAQRVAKGNYVFLMDRYMQELQKVKPDVKQVTTILPAQMPLGVDQGVVLRDMATEAAMQGFNYRFHRDDTPPKPGLNSVVLNFNPKAGPTQPGEQQPAELVNIGATLGKAMMLTRHLVDAPANVCTTKYFVDRARVIADGASLGQPGLQMDVLEDGDLEGKTAKNDKRMGLLLCVGQGNVYEDEADRQNRKPRLLEMMYTPPGWSKEKGGKTVMLVGKGIIFDTGGSDLKPSVSMHEMRGDMAGAAAVLGALQALKERPLPNVRVVALMPLTENRISGKSSLPQNIYTARSGKSVCINNTDAEGRLVLSDAMNYGLEKYKGQIDAAFTIATLTGGKSLGIGKQNSVGVLANHPDLLNGVNDILRKKLMRQTGRGMFTRRMYDHVTHSYGRGGTADVYNAGERPEYIRAGLITAGITDPDKDAQAYQADPKKFVENPAFMKQAYLSSFIDGGIFMVAAGMNSHPRDAQGNILKDKEDQSTVPYCHLDIAGAAFSKPDPFHGHEGWATGIGVQDLYLSLDAIAKGAIPLDASKTVTFPEKKPEQR